MWRRQKVKLPTLSPEEPYTHIVGFKATTLPALFLERCRATPNKVAFRAKGLGIYREVTWKEYLEHVENFCLGLVELGLERGERVAVMGDSCPEWMYADLGAQSAGAISYGIYPTSSLPEVKYLMENGGAKFFVAEDQEFVDKVLAVADELPQLRKIIVVDTKGTFMYDDPRLISFKEVEEIGLQRKAGAPGLFEVLVSQVKAEDIACLIYTSGTTGFPKGAMLNHNYFLQSNFNIVEVFPELFLTQELRQICYMTFVHMVGRLYDCYLPMLTGKNILHFGESVDVMAETTFEVSPEIFFGGPRTYEKMAAQTLVSMETSTRLKKAAYRWAMSIGRRYITKKWEQKKIPWHLNLLYRLAYLAVFRPLLDKAGFARLKVAFVSAAPVPPEVVALWQIWGVNLLELYGGTEMGGVCVQPENFPKPGNTGVPFPRIELRLTEEGEAIVKGPGPFVGYWRNEQATAETIKDDWVYTGDMCQVVSDKGDIKVVDRVKDIAITAGGKNISPSEIEKTLKASPYITEAIVFADGRKYPSGLIEIDFDTVSEWARAHGILYTGFTSLANHPKVYELIAKEVETANAQLARVEQVKKFRIIPKELDPEDEADAITATRKVQRRKMYEEFKELVDSMYTREEEARIAAELGEVKEVLH